LADAFPISGQIDPKAFPFLVVHLHRGGATGSLKVEGPSYHKALYFRGGRVLFGSSNDPRDQLGSILIEAGKITPEQLEDVNAKVGPGNPLAKVLSDTGFVSQRELSEAARAKVERILSDVLVYTAGSFDFEDGVLPKGAVDLKLSTERLIMSAVRHVADRNFVLRHIDGLDAVLGPTAEMVPRLGDIESETGGLPQQLDGRRTLKEAAAQTRLDEFEAAKIACGLLFLGLVERVPVAVTAAAAPPAIFGDAEAEAGSELDLGATAAQAFSPLTGESAPSAAAPDVEPEPAVTPADDDEPPPFVVSAEPEPTVSIPPAAAAEEVPAFVIPEPEPEPQRVPEPEPPPAAAPAAYEQPAASVDSRTRAASAEDAPAFSASPEPQPSPSSAHGDAREVPPPPVNASPTGLPLIMPEKRASTRRSSPRPDEAEIRPPRASRPSKEDLAALDELLNSRGTEGPLTPLEKPSVRTGAIPPMAGSRGGRRESAGGRTGVLFAGAALLLVAAGAWFYRDRLPIPGRSGPVAAVTPGPVVSAPATPAGAPNASPAAEPSPVGTASAPAPSAPGSPPVPASPAPSPRAAAPAITPAPPVAGGDGRALMRAGRFPEAARAFASSTRAAGRSAAVIQLLIACSGETVQKAVDNAGGPELLILPVKFQGRDCYRLGWGVYPSSARASAALRSVPEYFRLGGATPKVLSVSEAAP
jgi:hypothetical protein